MSMSTGQLGVFSNAQAAVTKPLKASHVYVAGSSFEVKGAGEWYVNGVYLRTPQRVNRSDVFQKAGTSLVLMRKGDDGWSLVDLRGSTTFKWSLRAVELYHCPRIPPGHSPPPVGWVCAEGEGPSPMLLPGKSPMLPFLKRPKEEEELEPAMGTSSSWVSSASRRAAQQAHDLLEPTSKRPLRGPSGRPIVVANPALGGSGVPDGAGRSPQPFLQSLKTSGPRSSRAPPGTMVNFLRSFRVVLTRPYVQVPWGYEWNDEFFTETGGRVVRNIQPQSPLDRWNVWQNVTGRPDLCVKPGDRLLKADGRWAFCEQEVCLNDSAQAEYLETPDLAAQQERRMVLEFMRPVARPAPPLRPRLEPTAKPTFNVLSTHGAAAASKWRCGGVSLTALGLVVASHLRPTRDTPRRLRRRAVVKAEVLPAQPVPEGIEAPPYVADPDQVRGWWNTQIVPKTEEEVAKMREAGRLAHRALDLAETLIVPGVTTEEMDKELHTFMCDHGAYPSDLQYKGFPKSVMISINEVICHGIPDLRPLEDGDLVNVDVTLYLNGFHADTARSWICGTGDATGQRLVTATREALSAAIASCAAGKPLKCIGEAVAEVAEREGFGIVKLDINLAT
eukprot:symbB.v1.2.026317.t1/scaffold2620.1/size74715/1